MAKTHANSEAVHMATNLETLHDAVPLLLTRALATGQRSSAWPAALAGASDTLRLGLLLGALHLHTSQKPLALRVATALECLLPRSTAYFTGLLARGLGLTLDAPLLTSSEQPCALRTAAALEHPPSLPLWSPTRLSDLLARWLWVMRDTLSLVAPKKPFALQTRTTIGSPLRESSTYLAFVPTPPPCL